MDTLGRLALSNKWLRARLAEMDNEEVVGYEGVAVFFLRQAALEQGFADEIVETIAAEGFSIITQQELSEAEIDRIKHSIRGGNWGKGPFAKGGGPPALVVVAFDPMPLAPSAADRAQYPALNNARILVKHRIRDSINRRLAASEQCNVLHSSDNNREAREYLETALPDRVEEILEAVGQLREPINESRLVRS
ncbi:MAG: hypothetical protein ACE5Q6_17390, partial [Dehalococcoidia bacterium]